jgi:hypothetical protein
MAFFNKTIKTLESNHLFLRPAHSYSLQLDSACLKLIAAVYSALRYKDMCVMLTVADVC